VLNREQDFDVATPVLHHDTFVGRVVQALALSQPPMTQPIARTICVELRSAGGDLPDSDAFALRRHGR
jgi:hypothetical protein